MTVRVLMAVGPRLPAVAIIAGEIIGTIGFGSRHADRTMRLKFVGGPLISPISGGSLQEGRPNNQT